MKSDAPKRAPPSHLSGEPDFYEDRDRRNGNALASLRGVKFLETMNRLWIVPPVGVPEGDTMVRRQFLPAEDSRGPVPVGC